LKAIVFGDNAPPRLVISAKRREKLRSNLLPVIDNIEFLYSLPTLCRDKQEVRLALAALPKPPFIVKENRIWTCSYLPAQDCAPKVVGLWGENDYGRGEKDSVDQNASY
jgi:hypothetical protein